TSWTKVLSSPVTSFAFDGPGIVYAGVLAHQSPGARQHILTRSSDSGRTWNDLILPQNPSAPTAPATSMTVMTNGNNLFVGVSYQDGTTSQLDFYNSNDGGNQWSSKFALTQV